MRTSYDRITLTLSGVVDEGGIKRVDCNAKTEVPAVTPTYTWTITKPDASTVNGSGEVATVVADDPGTYACTFTASASRECPPPDRTVGPELATVVDVTIAPAGMTTIEGLDSANYTATLTNAAGTAYAWHWEAPAGAGNNPTVNFSAPAGQTTHVIRAHWFADPDDRHWLVTGDDCSYDIKCDVTHVDGTCTGDAVFNVDANPTGSTTWPEFSSSTTIVVATRLVGTNTEWYVNGQGGFTRTAPIKTINCVATSQFYGMVDAHESEHVTQWTTEAPWMNLFDANNLYSNTLVNLTSLVSEAYLRTQIAAAVMTQDNTDSRTARDTVCAREIAAFAVDAGVAPHYCEVDAAEVPGLYNCVP